MEITKEKFNEYRRCQNLGIYNMLDYSSWQPRTFLTKDEWTYIISNYGELFDKFES